ncbi:MAG TPA: adenosine kinase [Rhodospirillaceae bacterium]|nr:adenosine kinase [Rhodospirillaceae bacterium]
MAKYDLLGIGNALVDVLSDADDDFLTRKNLPKGGMQLVDEGEADDLFATMSAPHQASGGSCANSMAGFASLGGKGAFIGKLKDDEFGRAFQVDMEKLGCAFAGLPAADGLPTGCCLVFVTPDAQRTMCTHLGTAALLAPEDLDETAIADSEIVYMEGYLFDQPVAQQAILRAANLTHTAGGAVAVTLSDSFCVDRHRGAFIDLVEHHTDILFANELEIVSLYEADSFDQAISCASGKCGIVCVTCGEKGAVIMAKGERIEGAAEPVAELVDTTGAGDQFAAGFLYGLSKGMDLARCGQIGAIAAAEVISHYGARPEQDLAALVAAKLS